MKYESIYYGYVPFATGDVEHHGIKGQKWGIRRFQNEDGSYTQAGLARYNKAKQDYVNAKKAYKSGTGSYRKLDDAKIGLKKAKKKLKEDIARDKGAEMYRHGKTIEDFEAKRRKITRTAKTIGNISVVAGYAGYVMNRPDVLNAINRRDIREMPVSVLAPAAVLAGTGIASQILNGKLSSDEKKMRKYWHNRGVDNG